MAEPALRIEQLQKTYPGGASALNGVSLSIDQGEFFALLGPNGAGKTSLIGIVSGSRTKSGGTVSVCGVSLDTDAAAAKSFLGVVPQDVNLNIFEKVIDIVVEQAGYYGIPRAEALRKAEKLLTKLGLWDKRNAQSQTLSGGMKRRLMIARALIHEPKVLLLDEPTAGVDVELRRGMWDFLRELNASGTTILLTTHYLEEAEQLCKRVAIINKGEIIEEGSVKSLLSKLSYATLFLDTVEPVTEAHLRLLSSLPIEREDENTLKLTLSPGDTVNETMRRLTGIGVQVSNIRNSGSRLEEIFMRLINNTA